MDSEAQHQQLSSDYMGMRPVLLPTNPQYNHLGVFQPPFPLHVNTATFIPSDSLTPMLLPSPQFFGGSVGAGVIPHFSPAPQHFLHQPQEPAGNSRGFLEYRTTVPNSRDTPARKPRRRRRRKPKRSDPAPSLTPSSETSSQPSTSLEAVPDPTPQLATDTAPSDSAEELNPREQWKEFSLETQQKLIEEEKHAVQRRLASRVGNESDNNEVNIFSEPNSAHAITCVYCSDLLRKWTSSLMHTSKS